MGTYASLFKERKSMIPEDKKEEFVSKVEKVFCDGGMMDMKLMRLFDKNIYTIQKASMQLDGMNVYYNYFEDDLWENAGFDIDKCCVWSNKIGWRQFYRVVVADSRVARDAKYIDLIGTYNPLTDPATVNIDAELAKKWIANGAQPTEVVSKIFKLAGITK